MKSIIFKSIFFLSLSLSISTLCYADNPSWSYRVLTDMYYTADTSHPNASHPYGFIYTYSHMNQARLNHALVVADYSGENIHSEIGIHAGDYVDTNYAAESQIARHIFSGFIGYKIFPNTWIDAGILPSHIGLESAISKDNWTLSRSLTADNTPYFETGFRTSYSPTQPLSLSLLLLNGWQSINDSNTSKSFGTQIQYKPNSHLVLNSSTFIGNEQPKNSPALMRYFHNFYVVYDFSEQWQTAFNLDTGWQEKTSANGLNSWHSWVVLARFKPSAKWAFCTRAERYSDLNAIINTSPFQCSSYSFNADYSINSHLLLRSELKTLLTNTYSSTLLSCAAIWEL